MRKEGNYEAASSIALLQERFRNLQKVKEMREGRKQLQMVMMTGTTTSSALPAAAASSSSEEPKWFLHPELTRSPRPVHGLAASFGFHTTGATEASLPPAVNVARSVQNLGCRSDVEVDTSLHL